MKIIIGTDKQQDDLYYLVSLISNKQLMTSISSNNHFLLSIQLSRLLFLQLYGVIV